MSEKRFKLIKGVKLGTHSGIWDNQKQHNMGIGDELWIGEVVAMLNEGVALAEENKELKKVNEDLREVNKENQLLHEENVKQCERWKNLYELKDAEVTARVDALNKVCEYYTSEVLFKSDVDPNKAVKEVINEILNTPIYEE